MKLHSRWAVLPVLAALAVFVGGFVATDVAQAAPKPAVCGDNKLNQPSEECDGRADDACPDLCLADCTCAPDPIEDLQARVGELERAFGRALSAISVLQAENADQAALIAALETDLAALQANSSLALAPFVSVDPNPINGLTGPHVIFEGANVHVRSGAGSTEEAGTLSGLGNLVVGYNESPALPDRSGAHNLVVGSEHNFSRVGGMVGGFGNTISGNFATVTGGTLNEASRRASSVSGGASNRASATDSSVAGGLENTAAGFGSAVGGGEANTATAFASSVTGGVGNEATGDHAWVGGGFINEAGGNFSSVSGGHFNDATGDVSSVSGGGSNEAFGFASSVSGGLANNATAFGASVSGGQLNLASGGAASVAGGRRNEASGDWSAVSGGGETVSAGTGNVASGDSATVSGGTAQTASADFSHTP